MASRRKSKTARKSPVMPSGNLDFALAMQGKSGALTHGDRRTKRLRARGDSRRAAVRDQL